MSTLESQALLLRAQLCVLQAQLAVSLLTAEQTETEPIVTTLPKAKKVRKPRQEKINKVRVSHVAVRQQFRTVQPGRR